MFIYQWLSIKFRGLANQLKADHPAALYGVLVRLGFSLFGLYLLYLAYIWGFNFIASKNLPAFDFSLIFVSFTLLLLLPLVFYSALVSSLSFLFQRDEVHFYFSLPISRPAVFAVKFIEIYLASGWMSFLALFTFLAAMQAHFKFPALLYLTGGIGLLFLLFIPVALAVIVVMLISRFFPIIRAKGILIVIGLLTGSSIIAAIRFMQPEKLASAEGKMRLVTFIQSLHRPWMTALPSEWITNIIVAQSRQDLSGILINFGMLLSLVLLLFALLYFLARRYYARIWQEAVVASPRAGGKVSGEWFFNLFPAAVRPFIKKDLLSFSRDTVEKGSLLILIPLCAAFFYSIHILGAQLQSGLVFLSSFFFVYIFVFFYASIVVAGLSGRWVLASVSMEQHNFKLIKHSPTDLAHFLRAKMLFGFIPLLVIGETLVLGAGLILGYSLPNLLLCLLIMLVFCWGLTMITLTLGTRQADFDITESLDFIVGYKGFLTLIYECVFIGSMVFLVALPAYYYLFYGLSRPFLLAISASLLVVVFIVWRLYCLYREGLKHLYQLGK